MGALKILHSVISDIWPSSSLVYIRIDINFTDVAAYIHPWEPWKIAKIKGKNLEKQGKKVWKNLDNLEIWKKYLADTLID